TVYALEMDSEDYELIKQNDGEPTPRSSGPAERLEEARRAQQALGVQVRHTLELPNRRLFDTFEARVLLAKEFRKYRPRLVIGFGDKTPLASPDHWQAMQITDAAVFYSRLTKWDEVFDHLPVHTIRAQLYFTLAFASLHLPPAAGHFVVDVGDTLERKLASIRCYRSQFPPEKSHVLDRIRAVAESAGLAAGFTAGETLASPRVLATNDMMGFLFGDDSQQSMG
ncbi:MAG: PIG-L family deacetylase, partial [Pirellulales bacterium]